MGTEDARLPREDFGMSFWQLATVGYAGFGCVERAVMSPIDPLPTFGPTEIPVSAPQGPTPPVWESLGVLL